MNTSLLGLYIVAVWSLLVTPGPVTLLVVRAGLREGMKHAFQTICGTNLASLILIGLSALFIHGVFAVGDIWFLWVRLLGCLYIVWMAYGMLRESTARQDSRASNGDVLHPEYAGFRKGLILVL